MEYSQIRHAIMPPLSRDDEHKIAVEFSRDRRAFANLVQNLPFTFKEMILDGDCDPPKAGQRWPMPRLEACHERILELTSRVEGSVTKRIVARAKWLKRRSIGSNRSRETGCRHTRCGGFAEHSPSRNKIPGD